MGLIYFTLTLRVKIFLLALFILPISLQAQLLKFDLYMGNDKIEDFEILSYKNSVEQIHRSNNGKIAIDKLIILQADSIFIKHSFYMNFFDLNKVKGNSYHADVAIKLNDITLNRPETFIMEPRGKKVDGLCNYCRMSFSFPTGNLKNKTIKGIELHFPKGKYSSSSGGRRVDSKNKKIEFFLSFTNQIDTIYPNQSLEFIKDTLLVKKNGWNYYDLRQYNLDVGNAERIFISIKALDDMVLGRRRMRNKDRNIIYLDRFKYRNDSIYFIDSELFNPEIDKIPLTYKIHYYDD